MYSRADIEAIYRVGPNYGNSSLIDEMPEETGLWPWIVEWHNMDGFGYGCVLDIYDQYVYIYSDVSGQLL